MVNQVTVRLGQIPKGARTKIISFGIPRTKNGVWAKTSTTLTPNKTFAKSDESNDNRPPLNGWKGLRSRERHDNESELCSRMEG